MDDRNLCNIIEAIQDDDTETLCRLLKKRRGKSLDIETDDCGTPLGFAVKCGHVDCIRCLVKYGANLDFVYRRVEQLIGRTTALHSAIWERNVSCARLLLQLGADPERDAGNDSEDFPFLLAAVTGCAEMVQLLLDYNVEIDQVAPEQGMTALMFAAKYGFPEVANILLENGCDKSLVCNNGMTALNIAVKTHHWDVVKILLSAGVSVDGLGDKKRLPLNVVAKKIW